MEKNRKIIKIVKIIAISLVASNIFLLPAKAQVTKQELLEINEQQTTKDKETKDKINLKQELLEKAALKKMSQYSELVKKDHKQYEIGNVNMVDGWALMSLDSYPINTPENVDAVVPDLYLAIAEEESENKWSVYIENEEEFQNKLKEAPEGLLSKEAKEGLVGNYKFTQQRNVQSLQTTIPIEENHVPGLPFPFGTGWRYNQGPFGPTHNGYQIDFGTPGGDISAMVKAAEDGVVVEAKETCLRVRRDSSNQELFYQHINKSDIKTKKQGDRIKLGDDIGMTVKEVYGCGGDSTGHHVHIEIIGKLLDGSSFNGWLVNGNDFMKEGIKRSPNNAFSAPTVSHGDWVIGKGSSAIIYYSGEARIPGNILVKNGSQLRFGPYSVIDFNFTSRKIEVQNGSGLLVKNGGKITKI